MEWVETTGRSVQEAKEAALDELGVDEADAEFEVIAEPQTGLFGRLRSEARVRARVRPTAPRSKDDRRNRDRKRRSGGSNGGASTGGSAGGGGSQGSAPAKGSSGRGSAAPAPTTQTTSAVASSDVSAQGTEASEDGADGSDGTATSASPGSGARRRNRNRQRGGNRPGSAPSSEERASAESADQDVQPGKGPEVEVDMDRQGEVAAEFLKQLAAEFGLDATLSVTRPDEDTVELQLSGSDLGILIGPKGATLLAVQNLTRTVVFNETGGNNGHINVDVGGYRQKRTEALIRFAQQVAEQVRSSGNRTPLEPMSAVDRKVVHDTISGIDGVSTISEGEEPRRRVVVLPG